MQSITEAWDFFFSLSKDLYSLGGNFAFNMDKGDPECLFIRLDEEEEALLKQYGVKLCFGAARTVFVAKKMDWVWKLGFGCDKEYTLYEEAKNLGLETAFVEVHKMPAFNISKMSFPIYFYEKMRWSSTQTDHFYKTFKKEIEKTAIEFSFVNPFPLFGKSRVVGWLIAKRLGKEKTLKLNDLLIKYRVNDLHNQNIGEKDGIWKIIDFAGYGNFDSSEGYYSHHSDSPWSDESC